MSRRRPITPPGPPARSYMDLVRWVEVRNDSGEAVPGGGLVRATGTVTADDADDADDAGYGVLTVDAPDADSQADLLVAHPAGIAAGGFGLATSDDFVPVRLDPDAATAVIGEEWGSEAGSFYLHENQTGWRIGASEVEYQDLRLAQCWRAESPSVGGAGGPFGMPCLTITKNGLGYVTDVTLSQRWVLADGTLECRTAAECGGDCATSPPPAPPSPPPPSPPYVPPDPEPETYDVWVQVDECAGITSESPYTVSVAGATPSSQAIAAGSGYWFQDIPWGTDTEVVITYAGSEVVWWSAASMGCEGAVGLGYGLEVPVDGDYCENMSVAFVIGTVTDCEPPNAPVDTGTVDEKPIIE